MRTDKPFETVTGSGPVSAPNTSGWNIHAVVGELRALRDRSLVTRQRAGNPPKLPSRKALGRIIEDLSAVLFPNRLGAGDLNDEGVDYFVGHTLDASLRALYDQVRRELRFVAEQQGAAEWDVAERAADITRRFAACLPAIRLLLESDIEAAYQGDPAALSVDEVLVCYPGITAVTHHRMAHELHRLGARLVARTVSEIAHSATGIDIHPGAQIGRSFFIDHGTGVVIGETAVIGDRVRLYQAVTLGAKRFPTDEQGNLLKGNARHPIVGDDVVIYAGATILGRITIGAGSTIGGNVWLTRSVAPGSVITQAVVRDEFFEGGGGI
ncbi:MAG: serine acetyltransferase [Methylococcaceae bacterium]|nr:serine acetyltransferase [Methylococcaceae bacterium]